MKKSLLALAALTAFAGVASAQSSVTLFGIVDLNARSTKTGSTTIKSLSQDGNASSRLGFRGVEDLGGGMRAGFWIEGALNPDTGNAAGQTWQRRSTVSLMGGFGEVRLGRDYTPSFWNYTVFDPFGTNGVAALTNIIGTLGSGAGTLVRANNTIGYFLPAMGGVYGQVQVAAGEGTTGNKYIGARLGYAGGPVNIAGAFGKTYRTGTMIDDYTDMNVGASFKMSFMTLTGQYSKRDYSTLDQTTYQIGALVPIGSGTFKASYAKSDGSTVANDADLIGLGYVYDLSKRTAVYAQFAKTDRTGSANDVTAYEFGVRHSF